MISLDIERALHSQKKAMEHPPMAATDDFIRTVTEQKARVDMLGVRL